MEERPLNFICDSNPEKIKFSDKDKNVVSKKVNNIYMAINELTIGIKEETLQKGFCNTILTSLESYVIDLFKQLNYYSKIQKEREDRYTEIKALNIENRELRRQLGEKVSAEDVRENLKNYTNIINKWWNEDGFGYIHKITYHPYVCSVKLSTRLTVHFVEGQVEKLQEKGYTIIQPEREVYYLSLTDSNVKLISKEIMKRFPSSKINKIVSNDMTIDTVEFFIKDFSNI